MMTHIHIRKCWFLETSSTELGLYKAEEVILQTNEIHLILSSAPLLSPATIVRHKNP